MLSVFIGLIEDRIDAVRIEGNSLLVQIVSNNKSSWCDKQLIPKLFTKDPATHIKKQNLLDFIQVFIYIFRKLGVLYHKRHSNKYIK